MLKGIVLLALLPAIGCSTGASSTASSALTDREFIQLYVDLRAAQDSTTSIEQFEQAKQKIFEEAAATPESMLQFVTDHRDDLSRMASVWDSIRIRIERVPDVPR